jgi:CheY-like chemotaxis protein
MTHTAQNYKQNYKVPIILVVEDDDGHADLIQEGLRESAVLNPILRFSDGATVWDFLNNRQIGENAYNPEQAYLMLLDINMPGMDGVEVLRRIKNSETLRSLPVIMLTTTDDPREIKHCYELGCNFYVAKPVDFQKLTETLRRLGLFIQIVQV